MATTSPSSTPLKSRRISSPIPITRPGFNALHTADRLREGSAMRNAPFRIGGKIQKGRRSVFREVGLDEQSPASPRPHYNADSGADADADADADVGQPDEKSCSSPRHSRSSSSPPRSILNPVEEEEDLSHRQAIPKPPPNRLRRRQASMPTNKPWYSLFAPSKNRPQVAAAAATPPAAVGGLSRFTMLALFIAVVVPALSFRNGPAVTNGAAAGVVRREQSPVEVCTRWAHQAAQINGTLYIYGGQVKEEADQTQNTWNNYFLTLDLNNDWTIDAPALKGLTVPRGPPKVSLGYLWQDYSHLYLYGGQFADNPYVDPEPESIWRYTPMDDSWVEFKEPLTSEGSYSEPGNVQVHRVAEGAGLSVPELGLSWYFGGHVDRATIPGWSLHIDRVFLNSLLEFTHPGYVNSHVTSLSDGSGAGEGGAFRNVTRAGVQSGNFPERADGALVFIPGWGEQGILIGLAGGAVDDFADNAKVLDVYDIANSEWYYQETTGDVPSVRVNPCAVVATPSDHSSFQVYMFGGQNLQPAGDQTQYDDMYILTIPSFTWIKVDQSDQNTPHPRAGHTCHMRDGQMVVVGGYVGKEVPCDSPGISVFDASTLKWRQEYKAGDHRPDLHPENSVLGGSSGYKVPQAVVDVIGGDEDGRATVTTPAAGPASDGPFATGKAPVITITQPGATATITQGFAGGEKGDDVDDTKPEDEPEEKGISPGLIAAAVIAGIAGAAACYLGFCAYIYRRQVRAYKQHLAVANRYSATDTSLGPGAILGGRFNTRQSATARSSQETFSWVPEPAWLSEPKWSSDEPSPGTASGGEASGEASGSARASGSQYAEKRPRTSGSGESSENLLDGQEPSFFNVVLGPRRALRVVNGAD